uniref:Ptu1-like peptide pp11 n=1 Tax=Pristhesancus plagipennis TaxID=1955184 RepID=A0A1Q1NP76_PRIPG|nr:ptu1-like peptide pp11 [Pristhesancus plagipennis]
MAVMKTIAVLLIVALVSFAVISSVESQCLPRGASCNRLSTIPVRCCFPMVCNWDSSTCAPATITVNG